MIYEQIFIPIACILAYVHSARILSKRMIEGSHCKYPSLADDGDDFGCYCGGAALALVFPISMTWYYMEKWTKREKKPSASKPLSYTVVRKDPPPHACELPDCFRQNLKWNHEDIIECNECGKRYRRNSVHFTWDKLPDDYEVFK